MCASQTQSVDLTTQNVNKKHSKEEEKKYYYSFGIRNTIITVDLTTKYAYQN